MCLYSFHLGLKCNPQTMEFLNKMKLSDPFAEKRTSIVQYDQDVNMSKSSSTVNPDEINIDDDDDDE
jgi:hypothetical protein